ncbi:MAG: class I SAM-dependent methyltransferase [Treponema sp.]|jgi:SAM-dependent methyltransferase|nr:class I SAM-dependent methyltransferase [Treponema sp.]
MEENALHFDTHSGIYSDVRPGYPNEVYETISKYKLFNKNSNILEIGSGNGIASQEIYNKWQPKLTLIEPGNNLHNLLKDRFNKNGGIKIYNTSFEEYNNEAVFDAIFSATAFHWCDIKTKYKKVHALLKNDGILILYWNNYGIEDEETYKEIQNIYVKYGKGRKDGKSVCEMQMEQIENRKREIEESGCFEILEHKIIKTVKEYDGNDYIKLIKTFSDHGKLNDKFFSEINAIIKNENEIKVRIVVNLEIARKI